MLWQESDHQREVLMKEKKKKKKKKPAFKVFIHRYIDCNYEGFWF